jgi:hypothetical protein
MRSIGGVGESDAPTIVSEIQTSFRLPHPDRSAVFPSPWRGGSLPRRPALVEAVRRGTI